MSCTETERTSAFLDGELDDKQAAAAERHIETCEHCQALVTVSAEVSEALRSPRARLAAPAGLKARIGEALDAETRPRASRPTFWQGMASGVGITALAASLVATIGLQPGPGPLSSALADAHIQALSSGRTFEVASSSHHTVKPWFAGRVPLSPPVGDFADKGFTLVGGRTAEVAGHKAAVVVYGHGAHEIDLFVWAASGAALPSSGDRLGYHETFWRRGDLDFAAVSDVDSAELARFVELVKAQRE